MDRYSTGSVIVKGSVKSSFKNVEFTKREELSKEVKIEEKPEPKKSSLKEIDDKLMTIEDFIDIDV